MALAYDVLLISDLRLPGPTGRAIAAEIRAQASAGYRTALLHVKSALLGRPHPIHPQIRAAIEQGLADWLDPDAAGSARLAVVHHPGIFSESPARAARPVAERKLLVVNHPLFDAEGRPWLDRRSLLRNLEDLLGEGVQLAPAGPQIRAQLTSARWPLPLLEQDWPPVLDPGTMPAPTRRAWSGRLVIGRHGELDRLAWPLPRPLLLVAYPEDADLEVRVLADRARLAALLGELPANWSVIDPATVSVADFLAGLDAWVHLSADAAQPVRLEILEALASGVPTVLPAALRDTFGGRRLRRGGRSARRDPRPRAALNAGRPGPARQRSGGAPVQPARPRRAAARPDRAAGADPESAAAARAAAAPARAVRSGRHRPRPAHPSARGRQALPAVD